MEPDTGDLVLRLQASGLRTDVPTEGRVGGAGPSDVSMLWVDDVAVTLDTDPDRSAGSPFELRADGDDTFAVYEDGRRVAPARTQSHPRYYDLTTADGIPYWKIALLHLDSLASTVLQTCAYWGNSDQCAFCGIAVSLEAGRTTAKKTPAQLAEVAVAARDLDGAVDVTLTTGSLNRRDRGALYISKCATAIKEACGLPVQVQFEPPDDLSVLDEVHAAGVDAVGMHLETFDPEVLARVAPGKAATGIDGYYRAWERAVEVFGRGRVSTYVILGMGEDRALTEEGCRRAIEMGVYPFVVPLRPVPGTLMADARPPAPDYVASIYRAVSAMLADAGFDHADAGAGCARCQACSGLSAWERVFEKERWRELAGRRAS
jgi:radical SAM protein (TIGR04043 family)